MANEYCLNIYVDFTIEVEHIFNCEEVEEADSIKEAFEIFGQEILEEIQFDFPDFELWDTPKRRNRENKYKLKFSGSMVCGFDEDEVAVEDEYLLEEPMKELEKEWKNSLSIINYPIIEISVDSDGIVETIHLDPLSAEDMAKRLVKKHDIWGDFFLEKDEFKRIAGKTNLKDAYINDVDFELRKKGYLLVDLINEKKTIAISSINTVMNWKQLD